MPAQDRGDNSEKTPGLSSNYGILEQWQRRGMGREEPLRCRAAGGRWR